MKYLPIGLQTFADLITQNFTYVDKTGILYEIIKKKGYYFLSRPRRFGKSMTCSTLEAIFDARKELFNGLAIGKTDYQWQRHPIIRLDFNEISHNGPEELTESLGLTLKRIAARYEVSLLQSTLVKDLLNDLVIKLAQKIGPVVIIIDEYDKPILDHIKNDSMATIMRDALKNFYGVLKGKEIDSNLRFLFMTGVSKFSKVSIFSELNNLNDLTNDEKAAALCGYTQEELEHVFSDHIDALAQAKKKSRFEILAELKQWYNGYQFSKNNLKVYNPFSILNCLSKNDFANYWFSSGTPSFIMHYAGKNPEAIKKLIMLEAERLTINQLEKLSLENYFQNFILLFLQAGYLTISRYNEDERLFDLAFPNYEVRLSMTEQIFEGIAHIEAPSLASMEYRFRKALREDNSENFCKTMKDFFALLPHTIIIDREKFYQGVFFTVTKLVGARINAEMATSRGYIDAVLEGHAKTYVIEFKRDKTPENALAQIEDKEYCAQFNIEGNKPVVLVGMNFDYAPESGVAVDWKIKY
jgi:hypothetical protein